MECTSRETPLRELDLGTCTNIDRLLDSGDTSSDEEEQIQTPLDTVPRGLSNHLVNVSEAEINLPGNMHIDETHEEYLSSIEAALKLLHDAPPSSATPDRLLGSTPSFKYVKEHTVPNQTNIPSFESTTIHAITEDQPKPFKITARDSAVTSSPLVYRCPDKSATLKPGIKKRPSPPPIKIPARSLQVLQPKPPLKRHYASDFLPVTLGRKYCPRFPFGHHIDALFVRYYKLGVELGCGGNGFVMTATRRLDAQDVAVKFIIKSKIPKQGWATDHNGKIMPLEAKVLKSVSHSGIVKFFDLYEDQVYFYLVQELHGTPWHSKGQESIEKRVGSNATEGVSPSTPDFPGLPPVPLTAVTTDKKSMFADSTNKQTYSNAPVSLPNSPVKAEQSRPQFLRQASHDLFEYIEQSEHKRLSEHDAKYVFAQVVAAVHYLAERGIYHRDIKDENLVINEKLEVKLVDFGSVTVIDPSEPGQYHKFFYGTTAYAASEILQKKLYKPAPAEVWTLGVLLSYLLTGYSPFPTSKHAISGNIILEESSEALVPKEALHLMTRCLEADPKHRADIDEVKSHPWLKGAFSGR